MENAYLPKCILYDPSRAVADNKAHQLGTATSIAIGGGTPIDQSDSIDVSASKTDDSDNQDD